MSSKVEVTFEFELGELVYVADAIHTNTARPRPFMIIERGMTECQGGVQKFYKLNGRLETPCFEPALTREEPKYRPDSNETLLLREHENHRRLTLRHRIMKQEITAEEKAVIRRGANSCE